MPNFKPKTNKKIRYNKKASITLDGKHKEFLNEFSKYETDIIPQLKLDKLGLTQQLEKENVMSVEEKLDIKDKINDITNQIKELKLKKKEYFLDNSKHIFDYFENKKNISQGTNEKTVNTKNKLVKSFFKINQESTNNISIYQTKNNNIVQKYLSNIDDIFLDINSYVCPTDICQYCFKGELIPIEDEGIIICNVCSRNVPYLIENEKPSYKEPPKEVCFYAYKRINHFKEILAQFQGKETTQIPLEVIENIKMQIKKERIDLSQISNLKTKEILKKLGYNK